MSATVDARLVQSPEGPARIADALERLDRIAFEMGRALARRVKEDIAENVAVADEVVQNADPTFFFLAYDE